MYTAQIIIERTQLRIKKLGLTQKDVLKECGLSENALKQMTDKKGIGSFSLGKIADKLDCSVDYLLGRTNKPNSLYTINNKNTTINGTQANVINNSEQLDEMSTELLKAFKNLSFTDKMEIMNTVLNKIER